MGDVLDEIAQSLDAAFVVVTAAHNQRRAGCLVGFHAQASIDPQRYCVWLSRANHTLLVATASTHVGVHFLASSDLELARRFGTQCSETSDKFAGLEVTTGPGGVPVLSDCRHRLVLRRTALIDGGDHVGLIGQIVEAHGDGTFAPLRLTQASDLEPGHDSHTRADL